MSLDARCRNRKPPACLLLAIVCASCGGGNGDAGAFGGEQWVVNGPVVRIGSVDDPDYAFRGVRALAMSPSGVLHSIHRGEAVVRRWNAQGQPAGNIGREGDGPGEFDTPDRLGFFGDSLWVMDQRAYRVSYFDSTGRFVGSVSPKVDLSPDPNNPAASVARPFIPLRDGSFHGLSPAWSEAIARGQLSEARHVLMNAEGDNLGTVWVQPYKPTDVLALLRDGGGTFSQQPFGDSPEFLVDPEGVLLVLNRRVFDGVGEAVVTLTKIGMDGDTVRSKDLEYVPEPLPRASIDSAAHAQAEAMFDFMQRMNANLEIGKLEADIREATFAPDYLPAVRGMVRAEDGSIWIERFSRTDEGVVWWVVGPDLEPRATAVTPTGLRVLLITGDAIWGVETDELDVDYIVKYDIVRM